MSGVNSLQINGDDECGDTAAVASVVAVESATLAPVAVVKATKEFGEADDNCDGGSHVAASSHGGSAVVDGGCVAVLERIAALASGFRKTLSRSAVRDAQRASLESQHATMVDLAVRSLTAAAEREMSMARRLSLAQDEAAEQALHNTTQQQRLRDNQQALQERCTAILGSVAELQRQFADERQGRQKAEQALLEVRARHHGRGHRNGGRVW